MVYYVSVTLSRFEEKVEAVVSNGFHPEIRMSNVGRLMELSDADIDRLRRRLEQRSLTGFTHGPFFGLDVAGIDETISRYSIESIVRGLEVTAAIGGKVMVVHTGYSPFFSRGGRRHWFRNWTERMSGVAGKAAELGVILALENTWEDKPEVLLHLAGMLPGEYVGFCLDTGHINAFSRLPVRRWWKCLGDRVVAVHLHDNDGLSDDHLPPGKGTFDFGTFVGLMKERGELPLLDFEVGIEEAVRGRRYIERLIGDA